MNCTLRRMIVWLCAFSLWSAHAAEDSENKETPPPAKKESTEPATPHKSEISEILDSMGYPELQVVPRASERLAIESRNEDATAAIMHWPMQFAGLSTLFVGFSAKSNQRPDLTTKEKSDANLISSITTAIGVGWIVLPGVISLQRPYRTGMNAVNKYQGKDEHSTLLRERLAEEALEKPARTIETLKTLETITTVAGTVASAWHTNETGRIIAAVGTVLAFTPYIFEDHTIEVYQKHQEYKKKIYTPIKSASLGYDPINKNFYPMSTLTWMF